MILRKQRMIDYPEGQRVAGVRHRFKQEEGTSGQVNIMYSKCICNILLIYYLVYPVYS